MLFSSTVRGVVMTLLPFVLCLLSSWRAGATVAVRDARPIGMSCYVQSDPNEDFEFEGLKDIEGFDKTQVNDKGDIFSTLASLRGLLVNLLKIILAICSLAVLLGAIFNLTSGDNGAAKRLGTWFIGFVVGMAMIQILGSLNPGHIMSGQSGLDSLRHDVGCLLQELVIIISMFTLVSTVLQLMRGEQGSAEKMIKWLITLSVGYVLLDVFTQGVF